MILISKNKGSANKHKNKSKNRFKILLYTGMRIHEFFHIKSENILIRNGINYLKLEVGKGKNGLREIPIHREILHILKNFDFENYWKKK